jgi:hypothetical protein
LEALELLLLLELLLARLERGRPLTHLLDAIHLMRHLLAQLLLEALKLPPATMPARGPPRPSDWRLVVDRVFLGGLRLTLPLLFLLLFLFLLVLVLVLLALLALLALLLSLLLLCSRARKAPRRRRRPSHRRPAQTLRRRHLACR